MEGLPAGSGASPYATFTPLLSVPNSALTQCCVRYPTLTTRRTLMLDLIYLALGLTGFVVFALGVRAVERM